MRIVIIGGGKLGFYLSKNMQAEGHDGYLIEKDKRRCTMLANELDAVVIAGDGTDINVLEYADIHKADAVVAVSGRDEDNIVACQIAKRMYQIPTVVARVNNPKNLEVMKRLGADVAVCNTEIITRIIEQEVDSQSLHLLASLNKGKTSVCAITLARDSELNGTMIKDLRIPADSLIISIVRDEKTIIPKGHTVILGGDEIVAVCNVENRHEFLKMLR